MLSLIFAVTADVALAQQAVSSFEELRALVKLRDAVTVSDVSGEKITGPVTALSSSSLELQIRDARRSFREADVRTISQRRHGNQARSAKRGFFIGEGIAVVSALGCAAQADCEVNWWLVAFGGAGGAGIGLALSAKGSERILYVSPRADSTTLTVLPLVTDERRGVVVSLGF
jgi:hypothetical protein